MGNEQTKSEVTTGFGIQSMDQNLQRKFSKGIQFNMKIVIKGDRNSGKTCLFQRLQGKAFQESYIPTDEIQVSSILWSYKETQDTVKVEVWDVVDKGKIQKKKKQGKLKMFNDPEVQDPSSQPLDAQFLDVYKGTHGVIFVFDMTKQWTYQYVTRELPLVPYHIPIIVLANFRDMGEHRVVSNLEAINFIEFLERPEGSADVRYAECSMKDGFGLKYLHKFFSIPFLHLQQESLLQQLQVNRELLVSTTDELAIDENSEEQNYELFKEAVAQKLKQREKRIADEKAAAEAATTGTNTEEQSTDDKGKETTQPPPLAPVVQQPSPPEGTRRSSFRAKLSQKFSNKKVSPVTAKKESTKEIPPKVSKSSAKEAVANIDDFVPDEEIDANFLTEEGDEHNKLFKKESDESDDDIVDNPLVAGDEDIDSEEDGPSPIKPVAMVADTKSITDDDDDDDEVESTDKKNEQKIPITSTTQQERSPEPIKLQKASPKPTEHQKTSPKPVKPVATRPALVSAKSVELTESSSEEEDDEAEQLVQTRKKQPIKAVKETVAPAPKFSGLKLEHSLPSSTPPKKADPPEEEISRVKDKESSASVAKEEKKKSRTKKKKQKEEVDDKDDVKQNTPVIASLTTDTAVANDPFSSSLLDAWLDSPTGDPLAPILQPTSTRKTEKVGSDQTADASEEKKKHRHKKHKHKHKHSETSASGEKKRQKHREPSTTTESSEPAGNDYVALL